MSPSNPHTLALETRNTALETQIATTKSHLASSLAQLQEILTSDTSPNTISTNTSTSSTTAVAAVNDLTSTQPHPPDTPPTPDPATLSQAHAIVRQHITLLTKYNEIKDVGLTLMGLIAEKDGKTLAEVLGDFGVDEND